MNPTFPDGVHAASLTPLDDGYNVHDALFATHVRWLLSNGCDGVVVLGTTGEAASLSFAERQRAVDVLVEADMPMARVLVGTGRCALAETVALTRHAVSRGAAGVLLLPPFYYKNPSDEGLFAGIDHIVQSVGEDALRIWLYHIPPVSQVPFGHALIGRLLERYPDTIVGMKDSGGELEHMRSIRQEFPQLRLFAGTERFLLDILRVGGAGCISAAANVSCALAGRVFQAWRQRASGIESLQERLSAVRQALEPFPMIPVLKALTARRSGDPAWQRVCPPLVALDEEAAEKAHAATASLLA